MRYSLRLLLSGYHRNHLILLDLLWYCINFLHVAVKLMLMPRPQCRYRMKWSSVYTLVMSSGLVVTVWQSLGVIRRRKWRRRDTVRRTLRQSSPHCLDGRRLLLQGPAAGSTHIFLCHQMWGLASLHPPEICRSGQSRFWPLKMLHFSFKTVVG